MTFKLHDKVGKATGSYSPRTYNHLEVSKYRFILIEFHITT
jgi:hypothetical protein